MRGAGGIERAGGIETAGGFEAAPDAGGAGTKPGRSRLAPGARLRLVSLRIAGSQMSFGPGLACVSVDARIRPKVALGLARAVSGPRPAGTDGIVEIAGRLVTLSSLPAPLLRASAASVVDRALLDDLWHDLCTYRRAGLERAQAERRLLRRRDAAALARTHDRARELDARVAAAPDPPSDEITPRIELLLDTIERLAPVASAQALALADAFDELARRPSPPAERPAAADLAAAGLAAAHARVATARIAAARASGGVRPHARARIDDCHRAVVAAESALFESRRKDRAGARARYQEALAEERAALTEGGVDSYAAFLVATAQGAAPVDLEARLRAELGLADAEAALREASAMPPASAVADEGSELRDRAAVLLGRAPGDDPASELRTLRVEHPDAPSRRAELGALLVDAGEASPRDVTVANIVPIAEAVVRARRAQLPVVAGEAEPAPLVPAPEFLEARAALEEETAALVRADAEHERALADIEREMVRCDRLANTAVFSLPPDALPFLLDGLLERYRAGDLLGGRLPLVVDGAFDDLGPRRAASVALHLGALDDIQVIVVTADRELARLLARNDATTVAWTGLLCAAHGGRTAVAACSRCGRASCLDCLVYVPGGPASRASRARRPRRPGELACCGGAEPDARRPAPASTACSPSG